MQQQLNSVTFLEVWKVQSRSHTILQSLALSDSESPIEGYWEQLSLLQIKQISGFSVEDNQMGVEDKQGDEMGVIEAILLNNNECLMIDVMGAV